MLQTCAAEADVFTKPQLFEWKTKNVRCVKIFSAAIEALGVKHWVEHIARSDIIALLYFLDQQN